MDFSAINVKAESGPESVPALVPASSGIDIQDVFGLIIHNLQDMGMPTDKDIGPIPPDERPGLGIIVAGRPADVGHQHLQALTFPATEISSTSFRNSLNSCENTPCESDMRPMYMEQHYSKCR